MRHRAVIHAAVLLALASGCGRHTVIPVSPEEDLGAVLARATDRATVRLDSGRYRLRDAGVSGKSLNIIGAGMGITVLETPSEGGLHFADSLYSALQDLTVTGVTVERGQLTLVAVRVDGGGMAVTGRAGARLIIRDSEIAGDHAVGLELLDGAAGTLEGSLIEGGASEGGVGLEIQPQARASVLNTVIRRHAKAASISPDARVEIHGNLIEGAHSSGLTGSGANWRVDDNVIWLAGTTPDEMTRLRVCGNLRALKYGTDSTFFGAFCRSRPDAD